MFSYFLSFKIKFENLCLLIGAYGLFIFNVLDFSYAKSIIKHWNSISYCKSQRVVFLFSPSILEFESRALALSYIPSNLFFETVLLSHQATQAEFSVHLGQLCPGMELQAWWPV